MRLRAAFFDGAKSAAWEVRKVKKKTKENNTQKVRKLFSSVRVQARDFRVMKKKNGKRTRKTWTSDEKSDRKVRIKTETKETVRRISEIKKIALNKIQVWS